MQKQAKIQDENIRKTRELPLYYTTDPQAEVLIRGPIPVEYIKKIHFENNKDFSYYFEIPFSKTELANYLSVDRSAMSTELKRMKEENIIDFEKNEFRLIK